MSYDLSLAQVRGIAAQLKATNATIAAGTLCKETDINKWKVGTGAAYNDTAYADLSGDEQRSANNVYAAMGLSDSRDNTGDQDLTGLLVEDDGGGIGLIESGVGVAPFILKNFVDGDGTEVQANTGSLQINVLPEATLRTIATESTTARTLGLGDRNTLINCTNSGATTITVAPQADVTWTGPHKILVRQGGTGQVTIAPGSGVTLQSSRSLSTYAQYSTIVLTRMASDVWDVNGDTE